MAPPLATFDSGSPPPTWGIPKATAKDFKHVGITPTYVGNTPVIRMVFVPVEDHPHLRGEYCKTFASLEIGRAHV